MFTHEINLSHFWRKVVIYLAVEVEIESTFALRRFAGVRIRLAAISLLYRGGERSIEANTLRYARDSNPAQATCLTHSP